MAKPKSEKLQVTARVTPEVKAVLEQLRWENRAETLPESNGKILTDFVISQGYDVEDAGTAE